MTQRIFVGDVQGCAEEFEELIRRARKRLGGDVEVWQVGDLVNRGPDSLRCLEVMRELVEMDRGKVVLGNHEIGLIAAYYGVRTLRPLDTLLPILDSREADDWIRWLCARPLVESGEIDDQPFVMVHASVHPEWEVPEILARARRAEARLDRGDAASVIAFLEADPATDSDADDLQRFTRCRSVGARDRWSSREPSSPSDAWHRRWRQRGHDYGVVYGHWALQRLHVAPGLRGIDNGCVHHGRGGKGMLTAWLPDSAPPEGDAPFATPDARFLSIPARRPYYVDLMERVADRG